MQPNAAVRRFFPELLLVATALFLPVLLNTQAQNESTRFDPIKPAGATTMRIGVTGPANRSLRVDVSTNLTSWAPFKLWPSSGVARREIDDLFAPGSRRFFRARDLDPAETRFAAWPNRGAPGDVIELTGQVFAEGRPDLHQVDIGGARAEVEKAASYAAGKAVKKIGQSLTAVGGVLKVLDIAGSTLQVAQRMDTLANSSAAVPRRIPAGPSGHSRRPAARPRGRTPPWPSGGRSTARAIQR